MAGQHDDRTSPTWGTKTLLTLATTIIFGLFSATAGFLYADVSDNQQEIRETKTCILEMSNEITRLKTTDEFIQESLEKIDSKLSRLDEKLDRLIEGR